MVAGVGRVTLRKFFSQRRSSFVVFVHKRKLEFQAAHDEELRRAHEAHLANLVSQFNAAQAQRRECIPSQPGGNGPG